METTKKRFTDKVIDSLKKAIVEIEEFQLQLALGKAEASDKYEEIKKKLTDAIHSAKIKLSDYKVKDLIAKFEELQLQLSLGRAETKDEFNKQKSKILAAIQAVEDALKKTNLGAELHADFSNEMEKFKIKMEILYLVFELGKIEIKEKLRDKKAQFNEKLNILKEKLTKHESVFEKKWDEFRDEINEAYVHLKKAFVKL